MRVYCWHYYGIASGGFLRGFFMGDFIQIAELLFRAGYDLVSYNKYYDTERHRYAMDVTICVLQDPPPAGANAAPSGS
jgi:hypothetical protein